MHLLMGCFFTKTNKNNDIPTNLYDNIEVKNAEFIIKKIIETNIDENINNITKKSLIIDLLYNYDMILCKLNTQYNKNEIKQKDNLIRNHLKIIEHLLNLKYKYVNPIVINII